MAIDRTSARDCGFSVTQNHDTADRLDRLRGETTGPGNFSRTVREVPASGASALRNPLPWRMSGKEMRGTPGRSSGVGCRTFNCRRRPPAGNAGGKIALGEILSFSTPTNDTFKKIALP